MLGMDASVWGKDHPAQRSARQADFFEAAQTRPERWALPSHSERDLTAE
jgi:hypothetical protein